MESFSVKGGAQIGWMKATWPFVALNVTRDRLTIVAKIVGTYEFTPEQIVAFEVWEGMTFGLHIVHTRSDYPKYVLFMSMGRPSALAAQIAEVGFVPKGVVPPEGIRYRSPVKMFLMFMAVMLAIALVLAVVGIALG